MYDRNEDSIAAIPVVESSNALESTEYPAIIRQRKVICANCGGNQYRRTSRRFKPGT